MLLMWVKIPQWKEPVDVHAITHVEQLTAFASWLHMERFKRSKGHQIAVLLLSDSGRQFPLPQKSSTPRFSSVLTKLTTACAATTGHSSLWHKRGLDQRKHRR